MRWKSIGRNHTGPPNNIFFSLGQHFSINKGRVINWKTLRAWYLSPKLLYSPNRYLQMEQILCRLVAVTHHWFTACGYFLWWFEKNCSSSFRCICILSLSQISLGVTLTTDLFIKNIIHEWLPVIFTHVVPVFVKTPVWPRKTWWCFPASPAAVYPHVSVIKLSLTPQYINKSNSVKKIVALAIQAYWSSNSGSKANTHLFFFRRCLSLQWRPKLFLARFSVFLFSFPGSGKAIS